MGIDPFVDFPGEWALLALGYTQPLQHFHSHLVRSTISNFSALYTLRDKYIPAIYLERDSANQEFQINIPCTDRERLCKNCTARPPSLSPLHSDSQSQRRTMQQADLERRAKMHRVLESWSRSRPPSVPPFPSKTSVQALPLKVAVLGRQKSFIVAKVSL